MMDKEKSLSEKYPSLNLAYGQVKDVLIQQKETMKDYGSRATTLLVVATALVGIGIPIGFTEGLGRIVLFGNFTVINLAAIPIIIYIGVAVVAYKACSFSLVKTMNNPTIILQYFCHLSQPKFTYEILLHIEEAFRHNKQIIAGRQKYLNALLPLVIAEAIAVVLWLWIALGFISS